MSLHIVESVENGGNSHIILVVTKKENLTVLAACSRAKSGLLTMKMLTLPASPPLPGLPDNPPERSGTPCWSHINVGDMWYCALKGQGKIEPRPPRPPLRPA